jgi:predicted ATPase
VGWVRRAAQDEDNFRAALILSLDEGDAETALQLVAGMWLHWLWAGRSEGVGWVERALAGPGHATPTAWRR